MNKLYLLVTFLLAGGTLAAQPWMPTDHKGPLKYSEALERYRQYSLQAGIADEPGERQGREERDNRSHLFERWNYYWTQHLDKDGYMVPPVKNLVEWQQYMKTHVHAAERTASVPSNWIFQGPSTSNHGYSGIGRINTVAFDPVDSNTFYVGSAAGGTWKTTNGGATWTPLYDFLPTLGVADIKVNPLNRNTIYVATGDGDHGDAYSSGVIVSHDGGLHWSTTGLTWLPTAYNSARSLLINPVDTTCMLLATDIGIFKTHNAGVTWTHVYSGGNFKQILYKPTDTSIVYGTVYTSTSSQIVRSTDGGITWNTVTSFLDAQRINIAVCPASPNIVKAIASNTTSGLKGIYGSADNGATYTALFTNDTSTCVNDLLNWELGLPTTGCGGQGWYDLCIAINPANALQVTVGGVNTYYSADGGLSWTLATEWYGGLPGVSTVHADKHYLGYNKLTGALFETCDGGVYKNYGPLTAAWTDLTDGLGISEFYRNAVDNAVPFCIGGAQDNGTKMVGGATPGDLTGGDGMQPLINYGDPNNIWYCSYQNGSIDITRDGGATYNSITATLPGSGAWVTPYVLHPADTATLLIGYKQVFVSYDNGGSWTPISPVFDTSQYIDRVVIAPTNPNYVYATYFNYDYWRPVIQYTNNFGVTWDTIATPFTNYISDIVVDPKNEKRFWVTISAYGVGKVWRYDMPTNTWTNETGSLPDIPVECMVIDTMFKTKYIGTDAAVYYKDTTMTDWSLYNTHLPTVHVSDLHINYATNELWAATFGRGMWKSTKSDLGPSLGIVAKGTKGMMTIAPNPSHGSFTIHTSGDLLKEAAVTVRVMTTDGKTAWQTSGMADANGSIKVNIQGLAAGFYICEVSSKNGIQRSKLVVY
jgi:hypothetical protein